MKHYNLNLIISLLLIVIIIITIIIIRLNGKNKEKKLFEYYRYHQFSALSRAEQAIKIAEKIKKGIELYNKVRTAIPKIKKIFETLTDWNKLRSKMCLWASKQQLLPGLLTVINKAINSSKIKPRVRTILEKVKRILIKIQVYQSVALGIQNILDLLPDISNNIKSGVDLFVKIDSNLVELFSKAGLNLGC